MKNIKRYLALTAGTLLVVSGIIITPLPIPTGIVMIAIGLSILISHSLTVRDKIKTLRARYKAFSHKLNSIKHKLPKFARQMIEDTDPKPKKHKQRLPRFKILKRKRSPANEN